MDDLEPISVYSDAQAVEDGILVEPYPDKFPGWLVTRGVFEVIERLAEMPQRCSVDPLLIPLLMDAALIVRAKRDHLHTKGLEGNVTGHTVWIGQNQRAYTLLFPEEN